MPEQWKRIPGFPGYDVSTWGNVRSYFRQKGGAWRIAETPQRFLRPGANQKGYPCVTLAHDGTVRRCGIASLILLAFVGPVPAGMECCHNDSIKWNNQLRNLRYDTHAGNMADMRGQTRQPQLSSGQKRLRAEWKRLEPQVVAIFADSTEILEESLPHYLPG